MTPKQAQIMLHLLEDAGWIDDPSGKLCEVIEGDGEDGAREYAAALDEIVQEAVSLVKDEDGFDLWYESFADILDEMLEDSDNLLNDEDD
jgi:hypothetical protein